MRTRRLHFSLARRTVTDSPERMLGDFAHEDGRSVYVELRADERSWSGGIEATQSRPAASLLKLPLAMAVEQALGHGALNEMVRVGDLLDTGDDVTVLRVLGSERLLSVGDLLGLMLAASDGPSGRYLLDRVGPAAVHAVLERVGCTGTTAVPCGAEPLAGTTTARDAVLLLRNACDRTRHPLTARALRHSILNSRIPLGATDHDVVLAHKTGTLRGIANDVAYIRGASGVAWVAFLSEEQHDTLVTGYEMGVCARRLLAWSGIAVERTVSVH